MSANPIPDLDATITAAVNARVEAEVLKALSGDETIGRFVASALLVQVKQSNDMYSSGKEPFLTHVLRLAIQDATKAAVSKLIIEEIDSIEAEVRKALRRDLAEIAGTLSHSLVDAAEKAYGVSVDLTLKMPNRS